MAFRESSDLKPFEKRVWLSSPTMHGGEAQYMLEVYERSFIANGYVPLFMEELSLEQQIFYIANASSVAALSGTLCHNIMFGSENTELIIINKTKRINGHQLVIKQMMNRILMCTESRMGRLSIWLIKIKNGWELRTRASFAEACGNSGTRMRQKRLRLRENNDGRANIDK